MLLREFYNNLCCGNVLKRPHCCDVVPQTDRHVGHSSGSVSFCLPVSVSNFFILFYFFREDFWNMPIGRALGICQAGVHPEQGAVNS